MGGGGASTTTSDAGQTVEQDAALGDGSEDAAMDGAADAGLPIDSGAEDSPGDAAPDGGSAGDAGCVRPPDCYVGHPGRCSICRWPLNFAVCVQGQCACACDEWDAAGEQ